jgi:hypothetical protein
MSLLISPGSDVTVVLTSCNRFDLLQRTLESFHQYNTYPIARFIITEDSGMTPPGDLTGYDVLVHRIGQISSIDRAYARVATPYIFHCEDDWEFYRPGFIERSKSILDLDPLILNVWLRAHDDTNGHPIEVNDYSSDYRLMALSYNEIWHGFSFNPGLRRLKDYVPYSTLAPWNPESSWEAEAGIGEHYRQRGFRAAILNPPEGYVRHSGWGRHVEPVMQTGDAIRRE